MVRQDLDQPLNMRHRVGLTDNAVVGEKNRIVVLDVKGSTVSAKACVPGAS